jgi:type IV pilus modification protein PilV
MKTFKFIHAPRGFSMIEVLISVVILGFGLLALAALQTTIIRSSSETKAQTIALQLAKDKLEDLRSYQNLAGYQALTSSNDTVNDSSGSLSGVNYTRAWTVTRWAYKPSTATFVSVTPLTGTTPTGGNPAIYTANNEYKRVAVVVSWSDANGTTQSIGIEDAVGAISPGDGSKIVLNNTSTSVPRYPRVVIYDPSNTAGVIPIAVGNGTDTAATNPKPEVAGNNNNKRVVETRFDVLTYSGLNGGTAQAQSRVETAVIGCTCNKANANANDITYRPTYWNGFRYATPSVASYAPKSGAASLANNAPPQSQYCDTCCRDHHDDSIATGKPKFDPRRTTHTHYKIVNGALVAAGANDDYVESCRLIRVDGVFRVAADMYNDYFNLLATKNDGTATAYAPTTQATTNYKNIVLDYLDARIINQANSLLYNTILTNAAVTVLEIARSINDPTSITMKLSNDYKWLHSRGLFVDYLEQEAIDKITNAKDNCVSPATLSSCVLRYTPFTSINMSELSNWSPLSGIQLVVSNNDFSGAGSGDPVRGKVIPGSNPTNNTTQIAYSTMNNSNSGVAVLPLAIDVDETTVSDSQNFAMGGGAPPVGTGSFSVNLNNYTFGQGSSNPNVKTTYSVLDCNPTLSTVNPYLCTVSQIDVLSALTIGKYNYEGTKVAYTATAGSSGVTCTSVNGNKTATNVGLTIVAGTANARRVCKNFTVATTSVGSIGAVGGTEGKGNETTTISGTFMNGTTINVGLTAGTDTPATITSCKFANNLYTGNATTITSPTIASADITLTWSDPCL